MTGAQSGPLPPGWPGPGRVAPPSRPALPAAIDRYAVRSVLGRGGMGVVYAAWDPGLERAVAIKVITAGSERARARFEREARALGRVAHPNIVPVHATGVHQGQPFVAMELVDGESLEARLRLTGPMGEVEAMRLVLPLCRALGHAHALGLVHRDVKPGNVLVGVGGVPRLTDFGLALDLEDQSRLSSSGVSLGSPGWWAPEQARGERAIGPATDVYGLGATLYHLLAGRAPHQGATLHEGIAAALAGPQPIAEVRPRVRPDVAAIVDRCLAKAPGERFQSMDALAAALEAAIASDGRPAPRGGGVPPWAVVAGAAAAAGLVVVAFVVGRGSSPPGSAAAAAPAPATPSEAATPSATRAPVPAAPVPATAGSARPGPTAEATAAPRDAERARELVARATSALRVGRPAEALPWAEEAARLAPDDPAALAALGEVLAELDRDADAVPVLRAALERGAGPRVRGHLATSLMHAGRPGEAEPEFGRALDDDPTLAQAWCDRALLRLNARGRDEEALADAGRALALDDGFPRAHFARGAALLRLQRIEPGLAELDRAIELEGGTYPAARHIRGLVLSQLERSAEAIVDLGLAIDSGMFGGAQLAELHGSRGWSRILIGDRAGALADYDAALRLAPEDAELLRKRATLHLVLGRTREGLADVDRSLAIEPRHAHGLGLRGGALMTLGRPDEALEALELAVTLDGPDATHGSAIQNRGNRCYARLSCGKPAGAEADAEWLLALDPRSTRALVGRGRARLALGRPAEAIPDATRAIELGITGGHAQLLRGEALLELGRRAEAWRDLTDAARMLEADPPARARARDLLAQAE